MTRSALQRQQQERREQLRTTTQQDKLDSICDFLASNGDNMIAMRAKAHLQDHVAAELDAHPKIKEPTTAQLAVDVDVLAPPTAPSPVVNLYAADVGRFYPTSVPQPELKFLMPLGPYVAQIRIPMRVRAQVHAPAAARARVPGGSPSAGAAPRCVRPCRPCPPYTCGTPDGPPYCSN